MTKIKIDVEIGFKTYFEGTGENALKLAKLCSTLASEYGLTIAVSVQTADIYRISREVDVPVLAQHVDAITYGRHTGWLLPEAAKEAGAIGSLLNHCERPLSLKLIKKTIERLKELDMLSVVCARSVEMSKKIAKFEPEIIMVEPPELVGTGIAVSKVKPELIRNAVKEIKKINPNVQVFCGAGISGKEDVKRALELGAEGVGISSFVVCAKDQRAALKEILDGVISARH
mgnify:CR=1 FL=1